MSDEFSDAYLRTTARSVGVPEMWLDDCVQEIRIALWREQGPPKMIARRRAVDFLRYVCGRDRTEGNTLRPTPFHFSHLDSLLQGADWLERGGGEERRLPIEEMLDTAAAIAALRPRDREILGMVLSGMTTAHASRTLGISDARARQLMHRVRAEIAQAVA